MLAPEPGACMRRRDFIGLVGGAAVAWPLVARAQQPERLRRIGVLVASPADDAESQARVAAFKEGLAQLGWTEGRNVRIDTRWATTNADDLRKHAAELAASTPDVLVGASGTTTVAALLQATRTVPIVFAIVVDPVGAGFVASLARPGGNATGFLMFEYGLSGKWLELLKQIAPGVTRAAVLRDPAIASGIGQFGALQSVAPSLRDGIEPGRRARCGRNRARRHRLRGHRKRWFGGDGQSVRQRSSRTDYRPCSPAQAARSLLATLLSRAAAA